MSVLAVERPVTGAVRRFLTFCRDLAAGIADGIAAAHRHERLSSMSDADLRRLGVSRRDIAWFALYGKQRPR
jgi:hypothetical protein